MSQSEDWLESHDFTPDHDDMEREWNSRRREFHVSGMRDGYEAGKEETVQEGFDQGFMLGARSGFAWGCVKGSASVSLAMRQNTEEEKHVLESVRDLHHVDIKKYACGALWDVHGEMKDRFPEHQTESVQTMDRTHNDIRDKAVKILPHIQDFVKPTTSK